MAAVNPVGIASSVPVSVPLFPTKPMANNTEQLSSSVSVCVVQRGRKGERKRERESKREREERERERERLLLSISSSLPTHTWPSRSMKVLTQQNSVTQFDSLH